jgi:prepilin-type N-terminal cleavage/methylation domain-containing protein/prepilin-type processing-associated H-X9-DG protein
MAKIDVAMQLGCHKLRRKRAFSLLELLVVTAIIAGLASLLLVGIAQAKTRAQAIRCKSNLRQIGFGLSMFMSENKDFPGGSFIQRDEGGQDYYVWPSRLLPHVSARTVFSCPSASRDSAWDTNANRTLGATLFDGEFDPYGITDRSKFQFGYNDWGIGQGQIALPEAPQLGMGGDVSGPFFKGPVDEPRVADPSAMIAFADAKVDGFWDGSIDPTEPGQWPSSRHSKKTNLQFLDGHSESATRRDVIDPNPNNPWRRRWNIDNKPHVEITWQVDWVIEAKSEM